MDESPAERFLEEAEGLSLTAQMLLGLLVFERFCQRHGLQAPVLAEFVEHLWCWPEVDDPEDFEPWESKRPQLLAYGFGAEEDAELAALLSAAAVPEVRFRAQVKGLVDILWRNFWGQADADIGRAALRTIVEAAAPADLPPVTPFKFSRFDDGDGWGRKATDADRIYWRTLRASA